MQSVDLFQNLHVNLHDRTNSVIKRKIEDSYLTSPSIRKVFEQDMENSDDSSMSDSYDEIFKVDQNMSPQIHNLKPQEIR